MPGSSSSFVVCLGMSAIGTPTRRDSLTFGPMYRPMMCNQLSQNMRGREELPISNCRLPNRNAFGNWKSAIGNPRTYTRFPRHMDLRHVTRSRLRLDERQRPNSGAADYSGQGRSDKPPPWVRFRIFERAL